MGQNKLEAIVFGQVVKALRINRLMTQMELGAGEGLLQSTISRIEVGNGSVDLSTILRIADGLKLGAADLMEIFTLSYTESLHGLLKGAAPTEEAQRLAAKAAAKGAGLQTIRTAVYLTIGKFEEGEAMAVLARVSYGHKAMYRHIKKSQKRC